MSSARRRKKGDTKRTGESCRRFAFAITQGRSKSEQLARRRAAILHLFSYLDVFDVVDEWEEESTAWVVVEPVDGISVDLARLLSEETPRYLRGSFQVDRSF